MKLHDIIEEMEEIEREMVCTGISRGEMIRMEERLYDLEEMAETYMGTRFVTMLQIGIPRGKV